MLMFTPTRSVENATKNHKIAAKRLRVRQPRFAHCLVVWRRFCCPMATIVADFAASDGGRRRPRGGTADFATNCSVPEITRTDNAISAIGRLGARFGGLCADLSAFYLVFGIDVGYTLTDAQLTEGPKVCPHSCTAKTKETDWPSLAYRLSDFAVTTARHFGCRDSAPLSPVRFHAVISVRTALLPSIKSWRFVA